jgi:2-keto-4-pentenoate hydratase/2-oxohepta-3-ene-1,7-dioic acid hydratase in catechol pathway
VLRELIGEGAALQGSCGANMLATTGRGELTRRRRAVIIGEPRLHETSFLPLPRSSKQRRSFVKIGFYDDYRPCVVTDEGVIDVSDITADLEQSTPQLLLESIILDWDTLRPKYEEAERTRTANPMDQVRMRAPVPRPGKVLNGNANYKEGFKIDPPRQLQSFFKSPDAVIGPNDTVVLPKFRASIFEHEAELCMVIGKQAKNVSIGSALSHVFGYTTGVDVSGRAPEEGEMPLPGGYGKSFDTFLPMGPYIVTADEIENPNDLQVSYKVNGELRQYYNTSDMEHPISYMIASFSHVMTLKPGDFIMAGTNHARLGPLQDGDHAEIWIEKIGTCAVNVRDDSKRKWDPNKLRPLDGLAEGRRRNMNNPHPGSWPFQAPGGAPREP